MFNKLWGELNNRNLHFLIFKCDIIYLFEKIITFIQLYFVQKLQNTYLQKWLSDNLSKGTNFDNFVLI